MPDSHEASSSFFNPPVPEIPTRAVSNEIRQTNGDPNGTPNHLTEAGAFRRDWLHQHGEIIMPGRCERPHCGRRRPVIDSLFLEEGDICMTCGYPRAQIFSPVMQCPCLCLCNEDTSPPTAEPDPISISDLRIMRYDIADREYNPADEPDSDVESLPDANSFAEVMVEELELTSRFSTPPDLWMADLVVQGHYTRQQMIRAFGFRAYELFYPGWQEVDEYGNVTTHRHPPPPAYNLQPRRCAWCDLIISDHRDACEECTRPLTRNDENSSIDVEPRSSEECACECDCRRDADSYQSSFTSRRGPGEAPRSPRQLNDSDGDDDLLYEASNLDLPESQEEDIEVEEVESRPLGVGWNPNFAFDYSGSGLRILRSGGVYSPIPSTVHDHSTISMGHDPDEIYDIDEFDELVPGA